MAAAVAGSAMLVAGCSSGNSGSSSSAATGSSSSATDPAAAPVTVRLGFLANITHAPALIALKNGYFSSALGSAGKVTATAFSSGTQETTAILAGQLDAAYVGPNPAINAWQKSSGAAIKIVSGVATGGASIVVKPSVTGAAQLKGQSLATPSLGNTQDVALRYWLKQQGLTTSATGGGDVSIKPTTPNSAAVLEFESGQIEGASEPAPYDVEMVKDGGKVLLSEPGVDHGADGHPVVPVRAPGRSSPTCSRPTFRRSTSSSPTRRRPNRTRTPSTRPTPARRSSRASWRTRSRRSTSPSTRTRRR